MKGHRHYVPILKSKQAEIEAIRDLTPAIKRKVTPLIELIPVPWDFDKNRPKLPLKDHVDKFIARLKKSWEPDLVFFLDLDLVNSATLISGLHPFEYLFSKLGYHASSCIPTTGLDRSEAYQQAVSNIQSTGGNGVCLRIRKEEIEDLLELGDNLGSLLEFLQVNPSQCSIIIDLETLPENKLDDMVEALIDTLEYFPHVKEWRSFTLASSSFPAALDGLQKDDNKFLPRQDLLLWSKLISRKNGLPRLPSFGDYAIQHPDLSDLDFRFIKSSVNLRYATTRDWLVFKGKEKIKHGYDQFNGICKLLVGRKEYCGSHYSWGDRYIDLCANGKDGPGNATTWRRVGFSHHITLTADQISSM